MKRVGVGMVCLALLLTACARKPPAAPAPAAAAPQRIVTLAPSATEILFALGLGQRVVGVTDFCDYPAEAATRPRVGGFTDPNYETIVGLRPDLCVVVATHSDLKTKIEQLGLATLEAPTETVAEIHQAVKLIAERCGATEAAGALLADLDQRAAAVKQAVAGRPRPKVLICIGRDTTAKELSGLYVAAPGTFYDELILAAGGVNACPAGQASYPQIAAEGVIAMDPEVIIDLGGKMETGQDPTARMIRDWDQLAVVAAVKQRRVHAIFGTHALRPSPRYVDFLEQLAKLMHPEAFAGEAHE